MKKEKQYLNTTEWKIEHFELSEKMQYVSAYETGGVIRIKTDACDQVDEIFLCRSDSKEFIKLPFFMDIKPTSFENDSVNYVVVIVGTNPCELHRLIVWFGGFDKGKPWFKFKVISLYDYCVCPEDQLHRIRSGHGIGGGTGGAA